MDLQLKAKVVLVTGGAKGIGAAIVRASAAEGAIPVFLDHDVEAGQQLRLPPRWRAQSPRRCLSPLRSPEQLSILIAGPQVNLSS